MYDIRVTRGRKKIMNESFIQTYLFFKIYINSIHFELMNYIWYKSNK